MHPPALDQLQQHLTSKGIRAALLASPFTVTWLTGYAPPVQTGPSPFEGGPALAWWDGSDLTLLVATDEAGAAEAAGVPFRSYVGYTIDEPMHGPQRQAAALRDLLHPAAQLSGPVAIEETWLPAPHLRVVQEELPAATLRPLDEEIAGLRAVKSAEELTKIRAALALSDLAQAEMARRIRAGISELALWGQVKAEVEQQAGTRVPVFTDVVAGARSAEIGGLPTRYVLQAGDPLILDFVPRLDGYWGDNAAVHVAGGDLSAQLARMRDVAWDTLRWGIGQVKPGVVARDLDQAMRARIQAAGYPAYPHHTGHGLGTSYHEEPRIVPYNPMVLQPGMVIALEPGIYLPGTGGVRLEHVVLVNQDGCEVLTRHLPP